MRPLQVHAHHRLAEALAAFGMVNPSSMRQEVFHSEGEQADAFFVTLRKTERHYSPTTLYQDYAISPLIQVCHRGRAAPPSRPAIRRGGWGRGGHPDRTRSVPRLRANALPACRRDQVHRARALMSRAEP